MPKTFYEVEGLVLLVEDASEGNKEAYHKKMAEAFIAIRNKTGMNRKRFSEWLGVPNQTIQDWEMVNSPIPEYLLRLIAYKVVNELGKGNIPLAKDILLQQEFDELYDENKEIDEGGNVEVTDVTDIISIIKNAGIEYVDCRDKRGALWIIGGNDLQEFVDSCNMYGYEFAFVSTGSNATDRRPGWWLKRGDKLNG